MTLKVELPVYDGPLDLLLHLISKNKINIFDIPIVTITEQYLDYVRQMEHEDMDLHEYLRNVKGGNEKEYNHYYDYFKMKYELRKN